MPPVTSAHYPPRAAARQMLGFNGQVTDPAIVALAADIGATVLRGGGSWSSVEDATTGALALPEKLKAGIAEAHALGIKPMLVAGYGSPFAPVREGKSPAIFTVKEAKAGSHTIMLDRSPNLPSAPGHYYLAQYNGTPFAWAQGEPSRLTAAGLLIVDASSGPAIVLATALGKDLTPGMKLIVNRSRYAPPGTRSLTDPWRGSLTDPWRAAYVRYLSFLATELATGYICVWNEPPWPQDGSIDLRDLYDHPAQGVSGGGMHTLLAQVWKEAKIPEGVKLVNGATDKLGGPAGLLKRYQPEVVGNIGPNHIDQPSPADLSIFAGEGSHPYGKNPEASLALPDLSGYVNPPVDGRSKFIEVIARQRGYGVAHGYDLQTFATECGGTAAAGEDKQARELLRRVLSLWMMGVPLACVYSLSGKGPFSVAHEVDGLVLRESGVALKRLMALMHGLGPEGYVFVPGFVAAEGNEWPMISGVFTGEKGSAIFIWQMTWSDKRENRKPDEGAKEGWWQIPQPPKANVEVEGPRMPKLAINVRTGEPVAVSEATDGHYVVGVDDDPVALIF